MRRSAKTRLRALLLAGSAALALAPAMAQAQDGVRTTYAIPAQDLGTALTQFGQQSEREIVFSADLTRNRRARAVAGEMTRGEALDALLAGTGLSYRLTPAGSIIVEAAQDPQGGSAGAGNAVQALIVTAQKREEDIQDVPIAISAFSQEDLTRSQIAGGPDLMTQVPNMTFTKTNFASYSIQIRGIGTQAISATTDPAVAVAFNNTPFVRNRFFEQEFYDLERIEVLRGPQGTLYGRNATAGVVNILSAKPKFVFEAKASADVGNYANRRLEGMINIPLVEDAVALRLAGAWTKRDGYVTNEISGAPIDGRDLWSARASLRFAPADAPFDVTFIYEHFEESDDRLRSGKQLCKKHRPTHIDGIALDLGQGGLGGEAATYSQGCEAVSLYSPDAFQTPNGFALPYYAALQGLGLALRDTNPNVQGTQVMDPYLSTTQSRDLRVIESTVDPDYRASSNIFELQANFDIGDSLTLTSETSYSTDELFSLQDLNRFNTTSGVFANHSKERVDKYPDYNLLTPGPNGGGIFCDPQIGCSDRLVAMDLSTAMSTQFSQEFRLGSDFDGPFNFSLGANFLRYDTLDKYYVFINTIALATLNSGFWEAQNPSKHPDPYIPNVTDNRGCARGGNPFLPPDPSRAIQIALGGCLYIDPNPIGSLNDQGHNYFLSKNPYKLISYAAFGEAYYELADDLKLTAGLRWTVDRKEAPRIPSMLLAGTQYVNRGRASGMETIGLTTDAVVSQEWREPTGRLAIDWKPDLAFTDETLVYASYAHGYKAGGANPPPTAIITYSSVGAAGRLDNFAIFPRTFDPEFIDSFEIGAKNTLLDGRLTVNTAAFYYDYKNYQVSEIVERSALNRNFDAEVWGVEIEADWRPIENLKLSFKGGYEKTRIADGEQAIDLMDRTAGDPDWVVARPFPATPSNCIVPTWLVTWRDTIFTGMDSWGLCVPIQNGLDPVTYLPYTPDPVLRSNAAGATPSSLFGFIEGFPNGFWQDYPGYDPTTNNNSQGIYKQLGGNELPNAPQFTATISADYTMPLGGDWLMALHTDLRWQSEAYWRVFNDLEYDKLDEFYTMNLAAIFTNEEAGWNVMAYIKNVTDVTALTGAFLFSDDTGLTTNVFLTEPRLYGLRATKTFSGGSLLGSFGARREGPYPFTLEIGGQAQRHDAPYETLAPDFAPAFSGAIDPLADQHQDLDWGDGRDVKLTYRVNPAWKLALGARFGKTNGTAGTIRSDLSEDVSCLKLDLNSCKTTPDYFEHAYTYSDQKVLGGEEHVIIDFEVGHDLGIGSKALGIISSISAGVRYAKLDSRTMTEILGIPEWEMPLYKWAKYGYNIVQRTSQHTHYDAKLTASREFDGAGPVLSWDASLPVLGDADTGRFNLDVSATAGVLFGKQNTSVTGSVVASYFDVPFNYGRFIEPTDIDTTPVDFQRSTSVTAPVVDISLGVSYTLDRMTISGGYRWERYFDAVDAGYATHEDADRTIDGPYFKLAIGFGG